MIPHDQLARMRLGVREAVVRAGGTMRGAARPALLTLLCAGALAPVVVAAVGSGVVAVAGIGVVGGMAGNVLSNVISSTVDRLRRHGPRSPADVERELTAHIEAVLAGDPETADELRQEIASLLRQIGAVHHAVEAAVEIDDEDAQAALIAAFGDLASQFAEFHFVLADIRVAADQLQKRIYREDAERRADRDLSRQQATQLQLIHEQLVLIERNAGKAENSGVARSRGRWQDDSPYQGLAPFLEHEAEVFYGRDRLTTELTTRVGQCAFGTGLLVITGPSGAGKSSLLRAGLFPAIARGVLPVPGSEHWPRLVLTPGIEPLTELAAQVSAISGVDAGSVRRELAEDPQEAGLLARQAVLSHAATLPADQRGEVSASGRLIVVVDQFEELFTLTSEDDPEGTRRAFIVALRSMSESADSGAETPSALVIAAVRGDFFDRCAGYPEFADPLRDGPFLVGPMTEGELRQAINGPAVAAGLELEDGLADAILADLRNTPVDRDFAVGALPLLSQTMLLTWQHRDGNRLTHRGYALTGGVPNVVETSAEEVYEALTPSQQRIARDMFRRLTTVTREGQLARQAVDRADLRKAASNNEAAEAGKADAVLDAFISKRLIVVADDHAEIAHDSVLRAWPRLRSWFDDDQAGRILYSQLIEDAVDWQAHERDHSFLYRGTRLAAVNQAKAIWYKEPDRYPILDNTVKDFLDHARRTDSRASRIRTLAIASLSVLLVMALITTGLAVSASKSANAQRVLAVSRQLVAQSQVLAAIDPTRAQLQAAAAWRINDGDSRVRAGMLRVLTNPAHWIASGSDPDTDAVAFSPDGRFLATGSDDGRVQRWDVINRRSLGKSKAGNRLGAVVFDSDGYITSARADTTVQRWNPADGTQTTVLRGIINEVGNAIFSPDGTFVAFNSLLGVLQLWSISTGRRITLEARHNHVHGYAFNGDGTILAAVLSEGIRLWDVQSGRFLRDIGEPVPKFQERAFSTLTVSPKGDFLAAGHWDGTMKLWHAQTGKLVKTLAGFSGPVTAAAFSPDGTVLATAMPDGTVRFWDTRTWQHVMTLAVSGTVRKLVFSPDGIKFATSSDEVRLWTNPIGRPLLRSAMSKKVSGDRLPDWSSAMLGIEGTLLSVGKLYPVTVYNAVDSLIRRHSSGYDSLINHVAVVGWTRKGSSLWIWDSFGRSRETEIPDLNNAIFSQDGTFLAGLDRDERVLIWNTGMRKTVRTINVGKRVHSLALDRTTLVVGSGGLVQLWNIGTGRLIRELDMADGDYVSKVFALSQNGKILATASPDSGTITYWTVDAGVRLGILKGHAGGVHALAYSSDGAILAAGAGNGAVWLWDTATGEPIENLKGHTKTVLALAFRDDGVLLSIDGDGVVRKWDVSYLRDPYRALCERAGRAMTRAEWKKYVGDLPFQEVCVQG